MPENVIFQYSYFTAGIKLQIINLIPAATIIPLPIPLLEYMVHINDITAYMGNIFCEHITYIVYLRYIIFDMLPIIIQLYYLKYILFV